MKKYNFASYADLTLENLRKEVECNPVVNCIMGNDRAVDFLYDNGWIGRSADKIGTKRLSDVEMEAFLEKARKEYGDGIIINPVSALDMKVFDDAFGK